MRRLLVACLLVTCVGTTAHAQTDYLDHDLGDYRWVIRHGPGLDQAIIDWHRRVVGSDIIEASIEHVLWRAGKEFSRWERQLGEPLTLRKLLNDIWPETTASVPPPDPSMRWVDKGPVLNRGPPGTPTARLSGMISPCLVRDTTPGEITMWYIGADGDRPDGGPAHRRLVKSTSTDGGASWSRNTAVKTWSPQRNVEEGVFSCSARLFSAVTAANSTTESVWSDIREIDGNEIVLDHLDRSVWGWGDELFVLAETTDGRMVYAAKGHDVRWGAGVLHPDGTTRALIDPQSSWEEVWGGSSFGPYVVIARGRDGTRTEFRHEDDLDTIIHAQVTGGRHMAPYYDGADWWLYGRWPGDGSAIRRWRLETVDSNPADELDPNTITWLHRNISGWDQTSTVTGITLPRDSEAPVCAFYDEAGQWPPYQDVPGDPNTVGDGNPWVFANIGGQWFGATFEWLRPGQQCKDGVTRTGSTSIGRHTKVPPMETWVPQHGEQVCFAMSTRARSLGPGSGPPLLRTNIACTLWP